MADRAKLEVTSVILKLSWEEKAKRAEAQHPTQEQETLVNLSTQTPDIDHWIASNKEKLATLLKPIVIHLFQAEQTMKE